MAHIIHINIASLLAKHFTFSHYLDEKQPDIVLVNETRYKQDQTSIKVNNYTTISRHDNPDGHGGTAIMIRNDLNATPLDTTHLNNDCCAIEATLPTCGKLAIISQYYRPEGNYTSNISPAHFQYFTQKFNACIFMGDYNAHHQNIVPTATATNTHGRQLHSVINQLNLDVQNNPSEPTRIDLTHNSSSVLDLALTTQNLSHQIEACYTGEDIGSDHLPLHLLLKSNTKPQYQTKYIRNIKKADWAMFKLEIAENLNQLLPLPEYEPLEALAHQAHNRMHTYTAAELDNNISQLQELIINAFDKACPEKPLRPNSFAVSSETLTLIRQKRKTRRLLQKNPGSTILKNTFNNLTTRVKIAISNEKRQKWHDVCSQLDYRNGSAFWKLFKQLNGNQTDRKQAKIKTINNQITKTDRETAEAFASHLNKVHQNHTGHHFNQKFKRQVDYYIHQHPEMFQPKFNITMEQDDNHPLLDPITIDQINEILKKAKNTAPGEDSISYQILRNLPLAAKEYLTKIYQTLKEVGYFPKQWKHAIGVMIPKPNKDRQLPSNYRPISLLRCLGKIFEKTIAKPLVEHLNDNNLLNQWQRAYLPNKEANEHIYRLHHHIKTATHYGWRGAAILLDVEKAFDSVWQNGLRYKLLNYQLPIKIIRLLSSFLEDRSIKVRVQKAISHTVPLEAGTPQGSVLSPILFNLFVNDLPFNEDSKVQISQFADDLALWVTNRGLKPHTKITRQLRQALSTLQKWCSKWHIKINANKSQLIPFPHAPKGDARHQYKFYLFDAEIPLCSKAKFLGLLLNSTLTLMPHCQEKKQEAIRRTNLLRRIRGTQWGAEVATLLHLYKTFIRPVLETGYVATASAPARSQKQLQIAECKALRAALKVFYTPGERRTTNNELYTMAKIVPIQHRLQQLKEKALARYADSPLLPHLYTKTNQIRDFPFPLGKTRHPYPLV